MLRTELQARKKVMVVENLKYLNILGQHFYVINVHVVPKQYWDLFVSTKCKITHSYIKVKICKQRIIRSAMRFFLYLFRLEEEGVVGDPVGQPVRLPPGALQGESSAPTVGKVRPTNRVPGWGVSLLLCFLLRRWS
jgi:hypothetical protein